MSKNRYISGKDRRKKINKKKPIFETKKTFMELIDGMYITLLSFFLKIIINI